MSALQGTLLAIEEQRLSWLLLRIRQEGQERRKAPARLTKRACLAGHSRGELLAHNSGRRKPEAARKERREIKGRTFKHGSKLQNVWQQQRQSDPQNRQIIVVGVRADEQGCYRGQAQRLTHRKKRLETTTIVSAAIATITCASIASDAGTPRVLTTA